MSMCYRGRRLCCRTDTAMAVGGHCCRIFCRWKVRLQATRSAVRSLDWKVDV